MEDSWRKLIAGSRSILILLPTRPFFDQVAAGLALYLSVRDKKETTIYSPEKLTVEFNRLIGVNKIVNEIGNKNLVIRFSDYEADGIERVSWDIEGDSFRLSVIPKPQTPAPKEDQVELGYSGIEADTVILVGGASTSHFPAVRKKELLGAKFAHVGTKDLRPDMEYNFMSFSQPASSVCEIVLQLIEGAGLLLDEDVATDLLMGIEQKTNGFSSPETEAATFEVVAKLLRAGGRRNPPVQDRSKYPPGAIPGEDGRAAVQSDIVGKSKDTPKDWLGPKIFKSSSTGTKE
jgi:hypothetical protein